MTDTAALPTGADQDSPVFVISVAAQLAGLHAQTLRGYDRLGLVCPSRVSGGGRRYSVRDIALLREVQRLSQDEGVNLAGVKRIIDLENTVEKLRTQVTTLLDALAEARDAAESATAAAHASHRRELVPRNRQTSLTVWRPQPNTH